MLIGTYYGQRCVCVIRWPPVHLPGVATLAVLNVEYVLLNGCLVGSLSDMLCPEIQMKIDAHFTPYAVCPQYSTSLMSERCVLCSVLMSPQLFWSFSLQLQLLPQQGRHCMHLFNNTQERSACS